MPKKISLREFQEYLAKRLTSAARGEVSSALLGVQSGGESWLLNLSDAGEIIPLPPLAPVPLTYPWFSGIANIRGNLYAVVDLAAFLGRDPTPHNANARLVLIGTRFGINAALLVNRMLGLRPRDAFTAVAATDEQPAWVEAVLADEAGQRWRKLDVPGLLADPAFMHVGV